MDLRKALKPQSILKFENESRQYIILKAVSRGASSIVYDAYYINHVNQKKKVRIKECYPICLPLTRENDCLMMQGKEERFRKEKERFRTSFCVLSEIYNSKELVNSIADCYEVYEANGTLYSVMDYTEGKDLSKVTFHKLSDVLKIMISISKVIQEIHNKKYLYLDLKPENVFVYPETFELIRFFDFDSMMKMEEIESGEELRITFSEGFAPIEQRMGKVSKIGTWSDIYGLGALLFYLIFGKTPTVLDSMEDAVYDYDNFLFSENHYRDQLYDVLTDIFTGTLQSFYEDRRLQVSGLIMLLEKAVGLADEKKAFLLSSHVEEPTFVVGREKEIREMIRWFHGNSNLLFLTGIGGIGKSTLIRKVISIIHKEIDAVYFVNCPDSVMEAVLDDRRVGIHTMSRYKQETEIEYYKRKISYLKEYCIKHRLLIVFDNFSDLKYKNICDMAEIGAKVICITRNEHVPASGRHLRIGAIKDKDDLHQLFEKNLGRSIKTEEANLADQMIRAVKGHTLTIEFMANQIRRSYLKFDDALRLLSMYGVTGIASEKIKVTRDGQMLYGKMSDLFTAVFDAGNLSEEKRNLLKTLTIFGEFGVDIKSYVFLTKTSVFDEINELSDAGWIHVNHDNAVFHPVLLETIENWKWNEKQMVTVKNVMTNLCEELDESKDYLYYGENIITWCNKKKIFLNEKEYLELAFQIMRRIGVDHEAFIIKNGEHLLPYFEGENKMILYDKVNYVYTIRKEYQRVRSILKQAKEYAAGQNIFIQGLYYEILGDYYDSILNGVFESEDRTERKIIQKSQHTLDLAIECMRKSENGQSDVHLLKNLTEKMIYCIRGYPLNRKAILKKRKIDKMAEECKKLIQKTESSDTEEVSAFFFAMAWYYCYVKPDIQKAKKYIESADKADQKIYPTDIDRIRFLLIPAANIFMELGAFSLSEIRIKQAIMLCEEHPADEVYQRETNELNSILEIILKYKKESES